MLKFPLISRITNYLLGFIPRLKELGFGDFNITTSAVLGKLEIEGYEGARTFCWFLHWFDAEHCKEAAKSELGID